MTIHTSTSPLLSIDCLLEMSEAIGIHITELPEGSSGNLYAWCGPDGGILYIGKSEGDRRVPEQRRWVEKAQDLFTDRTLPAFSTVLIKQNATQIPLYYDAEKSDLNQAKSLAKEGQWWGKMHQKMMKYRGSLTVREVERILIRMPLATGNITMNCSGAGIWNNYLNNLEDHLAQLAAIECGHREL